MMQNNFLLMKIEHILTKTLINKEITYFDYNNYVNLISSILENINSVCNNEINLNFENTSYSIDKNSILIQSNNYTSLFDGYLIISIKLLNGIINDIEPIITIKIPNKLIYT